MIIEYRPYDRDGTLPLDQKLRGLVFVFLGDF